MLRQQERQCDAHRGDGGGHGDRERPRPQPLGEPDRPAQQGVDGEVEGAPTTPVAKPQMPAIQ